MGYKHESCVENKKLCYYCCRHYSDGIGVMFTLLRSPELHELDVGDKYKYFNLDVRDEYFKDLDLEKFYEEKVWTSGPSYRSFYNACLFFYHKTKEEWNVRRRSPYIRRDDVIFDI